MTRCTLALALAIAILPACRSKDQEPKGAPDPPAATPEPTQDPRSETNSQPEAHPLATSDDASPQEPPPLPAWWFDEPLWVDGRLSVCLQATARSQREAGEDVSRQLMSTIREAFGERAVVVGVTQDITLLTDGRVRVAALFDIAPKPDEATDGD